MKYAGIFLIAIGVMLTGYSIHIMSRIASAKSVIDTVTKQIEHNPYNGNTGRAIKESVSRYDLPVRIALIGGIVLTIAGGGLLFFRRKKS